MAARSTVETEALKTLAMIDQAVAKSTARFSDLRKSADDLYEDRVRELAKEHGVDAVAAHGLAAQDDVASRAYAISCELSEREAKAVAAGNGLAAYIE